MGHLDYLGQFITIVFLRRYTFNDLYSNNEHYNNNDLRHSDYMTSPYTDILDDILFSLIPL